MTHNGLAYLDTQICASNSCRWEIEQFNQSNICDSLSNHCLLLCDPTKSKLQAAF
jgi:hypothetical protein